MKNYRTVFCTLMLATSLVVVNHDIAFGEEAAPVEENNTQAVAKSPVNAYIGSPIVSVNIAGNKLVKQDTILAAVKVKTGDVLAEEAIKQDMRSIYELGTFMDVIVNFEQVPEGVKVIYTVLENPILKDVAVVGNTKVTTEQILGMIHVPKGEIVNTKALHQDTKAIEQYYHDKGYIFTKVSDIGMSPEGVLTVTLNEGTLEGFAVKGNEKTKERVITREMRLKPGEPFNVKDARRSMQRVYNLGFFDDVNMKLNPGREPNAVVLETDVVERRTGSFAIGAGYSSSDGMVGLLSVGDTNFRGTGDAVKVQWEFGGDSDSYDSYQFSYTRPWLDSKQTSGTIRLYDMTSEYDDYDRNGNNVATYDKNYKGFELGFSRPASEYSTNYITLKNRDDEYVEYVSGEVYSDAYKKDNFGTTQSITLAHVTDTRDNIYNPTEGARASISAEFAGFGGDFDYNKYTYEDRHYFKVGRDHVVAVRGTLGLAEGSMPEAGLFDAGGQNTLRGYRDDQFEGKKIALGTVEYRFPIVSKVKGAVFTDFGDAWTGSYSEMDMHYSVGVGLSMDTPLGPIRLDYGRGEDGGRTHFSFGGSF